MIWRAKASGRVDTADFLCLQHSQLLHPSPSASSAQLPVSTMDSDLPTGAALPWRRAVCSLELAVCCEAACDLIFRHRPHQHHHHHFTVQHPFHHLSILCILVYHRCLCLLRANCFKRRGVLRCGSSDAAWGRRWRQKRELLQNAAALVSAHVNVWSISRTDTQPRHVGGVRGNVFF